MAGKAAALVLLALVTAIGLLTEAAPAAGTECPNADVASAQLTLDEFDYSAFCVINEFRAASGVPRLHPNPLLPPAPGDYTNAPPRGRFFPHTGAFAGHDDVCTPFLRLRVIGYVRPG